MANIGALVVDLQANSAVFVAEMNKARQASERTARGVEAHLAGMKRAFDQVSRAVGALGLGLSIGAVQAFAERTVVAAAAIGELGDQLGLSTDALQAYRRGALQAGVSTDQIDQALRRLANQLGVAAQGNAEVIRQFESLGVRIQDADGRMLPFQANLEAVADALAKIEDPARRAAAANQLFGEIGVRLTRVFGQGAAHLRAYEDQARAAGAVIDGSVVSRAEELARAWSTMRQEMEAIAAGPAVAAFEAIAAALRIIRETVVGTPERITDADTARRIQEDLDRDRSGGIAGILSDRGTRNPRARGTGAKDPNESALDAMRDRLEQANLAFLGLERQAAISEAVARLNGQATERQREVMRGLAEQVYDLTEAQKQLNETEQLGQQIWDQTRTQGELLRDRIAEINFAFNEGVIDVDTYTRAIADAHFKFTGLGDAVESFGSAVSDAFEGAIVRGESLTQVLSNLGLELGRILVRLAVLEPLSQGIRSGLGSLFGNLFGSATGSGVQPTVTVNPLADGGIMTPRGPVPLRRYAGGGVASSPQVALFGEGSMNEAFVPLPDGNSIPVVMSGNGGGGQTNVFNIDARGAERGTEIRIRAAVAEAVGRSLEASAAQAQQGGRYARAIGRRK